MVNNLLSLTTKLEWDSIDRLAQTWEGCLEFTALYLGDGDWEMSLGNNFLQLEIRSVEHGICPIAEFTSPLLSCAAISAIRP